MTILSILFSCIAWGFDPANAKISMDDQYGRNTIRTYPNQRLEYIFHAPKLIHTPYAVIDEEEIGGTRCGDNTFPYTSFKMNWKMDYGADWELVLYHSD